LTVSTQLMDALLTGDYKTRFASDSSQYMKFDRIELQFDKLDKESGTMDFTVTFLYGDKPINHIKTYCIYVGDALTLFGVYCGEVKVILRR
jgi:hypothetical protein